MVLGEEASADNFKIRDKIGFVYDEQGFYIGMTIKDIGKITAPYYQDWNNDEFYRLIEKYRMLLEMTLDSYLTDHLSLLLLIAGFAILLFIASAKLSITIYSKKDI